MKPFEVIEETEEYRDGKRFAVIRAKMKTPEEKEVAWTYVKQGDGVIVIPIDKDKNTYIKKEWRLNRKDFVWELPSGWIEKENAIEADALDAGNKELQEEVGLKGNTLKLLGSFYLSNHSTTKFFVILATNLEESQLDKDEHEHISAEKIAFEQAYKRLIEDQIPTAQILIALKLAKEYLDKN